MDAVRVDHTRWTEDAPVSVRARVRSLMLLAVGFVTVGGAAVLSLLFTSDPVAGGSRAPLTICVVGLVACAWLLVFYIWRSLHRWVTEPLSRLEASVSLVADGALNRPVGTEGPAEFAALAHAVEAMRRRILTDLEEAMRVNEALAQDAPVASALRAALAQHSVALPDGTVVESRILPAEGVIAGDWVAVVEPQAPGAPLRVALGDVSGHGPSAGILALRAKEAFLAAAHQSLPPAACLAWMAAQLGDLGESFLTCAVLEVDPLTGQGLFASAGHPPSVLVSGDVLVALEPTGPLLGSFAATWSSVAFALDPGEGVVLYTDGIVESRDAVGGELGESRLMELVGREWQGGPVEVADAVVAATIDHTSGPARDDITVVVVRMTSPDRAPAAG